MKYFSRIIDWFTTWYYPVSGELIDALEKASKEAGLANNNLTPYSYELFTGRKNVYIRVRNPLSLNHWLNRVIYIWQGRPLPITLYQPQATGFIGPFAKIRKSSRSKGKIKENALIFWPATNGEINPQETKFVLKVAVGAKTLAREIRMMRILEKGMGITPKLLAYSNTLHWHMLDFIGNAKRENEAVQSKMYLDRIATPYFDFWNTKTISVERYLRDNGISKSQFTAFANEFQIPNTEKIFEGRLTGSITHGGGICEECLLTDNSKPYLLDWEKARLAPIAEDFIQVFVHHPEQTVDTFANMINENALSAHEQIVVSFMRRVHLNNNKPRQNQKKIKLDKLVSQLLQEYYDR